MDSVIGYIGAPALSLLSFGSFVAWEKQAMNAVQNAVIASQEHVLVRGGEQYVTDNAASLAATATATNPVTVTVAQLVAQGYVPAGTAAINAFGQAWSIEVTQPAANQLQAVLLSSGGRAVTDPKQLVSVAAEVGAEGGFVPWPGQLGDSTMSPATARGAFGAWQVSLANYANPGSGHFAALLSFSNANTNNNFLYRVAVPGHPELNAMQTDLGMTDQGGTAHNIAGANNVGTNTVTASQDVQPGRTAAAGGSCATLDAISSIPGTGVLYSCVQTPSGLEWQPAGTQIATNGASCPQSGAAGVTTAGVQEICTNGVWAPLNARLGAWSLVAAYYVQGDGSTVPAPNCGGGLGAQAAVTPAQWDSTSALSWQFTATASGPNFTINMKDGSGVPLPTAWAAVQIYCRWQ